MRKLVQILGIAGLIWMSSTVQSHAQMPSTADLQWQFDYDDHGHISRLIDPAGRKTIIERQVNAKGHLSQIRRTTADGEQVSYSVDVFGRRSSMQDILGTVYYDYDGFGRLATVRRDGQPKLYYTYDVQDRLASMAIGTDWHVTYIYDYLGRVSEIGTPVGAITYRYHAASGSIERTFPNGVSTVWKTRPDGALASIIHVTSDRHVLIRYEYEYWPDGLVRSIEETSATGRRRIIYEYDNSQRLTAVEDSGSGRIKYTYDSLGNRTERRVDGQVPLTSTYDWAGRLQTHAGEMVRHDPSGNLVGLAQVGGPSFRYDTGQMLVSADAGSGKITYRYDGDTRLVERIVGKKLTRFIVDPTSDAWNPIVAIGAKQRTYYIWDRDVLVASVDDHGPTFYLHDHLGSVRAKLDYSAKRVEYLRYDPFGRPLTKPTSALPRAGFASMMYDPTAQLYLTPGRPYQPELGRFLQFDPELRIPMGSQEDLSLYPYCNNDPVNYVDRSGAKREGVSPRGIDWLERKRVWENQAESVLQRTKRLRNQTTTPRGEAAEAYVAEQERARLKGSGTIKAGKDRKIFTREYITGKPHRGRVRQSDILRKVDVYVVDAKGHRLAIEVKLGKRSLSDKLVRQELARDIKLLKTGQVDEIRWNFFPTTVTHNFEYKGGPDRKLKHMMDTLQEKYNFNYKVHNNPIQYPARNAKPIRSLLTKHGTRGLQAVEAVTHLGGVVLGGIDALDAFVNNTGPSLMGAFGETGLQERAAFSLKKYKEKGVVPGYTGDITRTYSDGSVYQRTGSLEIESKGITRIDDVSVTAQGYRYNRNTHIQSRGMNAFANLMQGRYPLAGYDPSDTITTRTSRQKRYRQVVKGGVRSMQSLPLAPTPFLLRDAISTGLAAGQPHKVGGIYLRGAAKALEGLGELSGVAVDEKNGGLIILSEQGDLTLPPLRLDDIVTVFRAVYKHGVSPWVSIDPDPDDPNGPLMHVVHGPETANTFVGWVLFEADRVMKGYSLETDNITQNRIKSQIDGYRHLLHRDFVNVDQEGPQRWERFWLSPAEVKRLQSTSGNITLFDVPLKVATEVMIMSHGKLVSASDAMSASGREVPSSPGARAFSQWFSNHYDGIESEWRSMPPPGSGIEGGVNVFFELRRIALIAGIAEKLRNDGVPFPAWMREHKVKSISMDPTTRAIKLEDVHQTTKHEAGTQTVTTTTRRIYGGVNLSAPDRDVYDVPASSVAEAIAKPIKEVLRNGELLRQVEFRAANTNYRATVLPGAESRDIGGLSLEEVDLWVPALLGGGISLTRKYHSFHKPVTSFGMGWTLDLPRLTEHPRPTKRTSDMTAFTTGYELHSPLNNWSSIFTHKKMVPELGGTLLVPRERSDILAVARLSGKTGPTVFFRDGRRLHFNEKGYLLSVETAPSKMVYRRDENGRLLRLESWHGEKRFADITLEYDLHGRVTSARGSDGAMVSYVYNAIGNLEQVITDAGVTEYASQDGLITAIRRNDQEVANFQYNERGQLQREWRESGGATTYVISRSNEGTKLIIQSPDQSTCNEGVTPSGCGESDVLTTIIAYDSDLRPRLHVSPDGSRTAWSETADGSRQLAFILPDGAQTIMRESADEKRVDVTLAEGGQLQIAKDEAGRITALQKSGELLFRQVWRSDGQLGRREYAGITVQPEYGDKGMMTGLLVGAPTAGSQFKLWTHATYDSLGRPSEISDSSGMKMQIAWRRANDLDYPDEPVAIVTNRGQVSINHSDDRRATDIATSWGTQERREHHGLNGALSRFHLQSGDEQATVEIDNGRVTKIQQFDGGEHTFDYHEEHAGQLGRIRTPSNVDLHYDYDEAYRLQSIRISGLYRINYKYDHKDRITRISRIPIEE